MVKWSATLKSWPVERRGVGIEALGGPWRESDL
jgi:hypothetical protein